jgi:thermosome
MEITQMTQAQFTQINGQPVMILREGTSRSRGRDAQRSNITAAKVIAETVKSSLGPKGMDKMLVDGLGDITITSDGATILKEMDVQHPAAKMMVEVSKTTDDEVGDGTTSVVVLSGHPTIIVDGYRAAAAHALTVYTDIAITVSPTDTVMLKKAAMTSMGSKLVADYRDFLSDIAVDAVLHIAQQVDGEYTIDLDDIKVDKKAGESLLGTQLIEGIAIDKEIVHSGMPKRIDDANIALINSPLENEKTEFTAKISIERPEEMQAFLDQEEHMLRDMVAKITTAGANVLICQKGIDDVAQHFLAKAGIIAIRRCTQSNMEKLAKATGAKIIANLDNLTATDLGYAQLVEERKVGDDKWVFVEGCKNPKAVTLLIRGGTEKVIDEADRSLHDALCVVRDIVLNPQVVAGGGAPEMEVAAQTRKWAETLSGKEQLAAIAFADALEVIPTTLAENAGLDPIDILVELRSRHEKGDLWTGVDVFSGEVNDMTELDVYEPLVVKEQIITSASEAGKSGMPSPPPGGPPGGPGDMDFD